MKHISCSLLCILLSAGCAVSTQRFQDVSYDEEGNVVRQVSAKSRTYSPPFQGAHSHDDHRLLMLEEGSDWAIEMGSLSNIKGGDSTTHAQALAEALKLIRMVP